ncbi:MAG: UDP-2,3-diacylglucosamine diphosphatase, partial [Bacteroidaceae bacterium]|nr:UDP-2,3-diacylglucosamine diphosphatase [Bacteroidaceae bacterium]
MKNIYFISDAHLGSRALKHTRQQERRLVRFLDEIKDRASAVYMLGDMFDFWHEYRTVVPRGFTRFLGKVSELTDSGVEVHFFMGNHDLWCNNYLRDECGVIMHSGPVAVELADQTFFLAHGDGLGDEDWKFKCLRHLFHSPFCKWAFSVVHPSWGMEFGLRWAKASRLKHASSAVDGVDGDPPYMGEDKEPLVRFAKDYLKTHPDINFFLFGHRHIELDLMLSHHSRLLILGDWITQCTYAVFDGERLYL